jgi:hypothetical protein
MRTWLSVAMGMMAAVAAVAGPKDSGDKDELALEEKEKSVLGLDLVINARPASLLVNAGGSKFEVGGGDGTSARLSTVYMMPNISIGLGVDMSKLYLDATVGAGLLVNDQFRSFLYQADIALSAELSESLFVGPRVGIIVFPDPEWIGDGECEFDGTTGFLVGLQMYMGDRISYLLSADLIFADFNAGGAGLDELADPDADSLEFTGLAVQFGVRGEF